MVGLTKPRVFIASSVEGLPIAEAINANLDHETFPTLWKDGTFHLGSHSLDDLVRKSSQVDFSIFVFTPDDVATIRQKEALTVRDNVLFELGLFIGAIGKERCFMVKPRGTDMHLPSDLLGITAADYATDRGDSDWFSALNAPCAKIKSEIGRLGLFRVRGAGGDASCASSLPNPTVYDLSSFDVQVLGAIAKANVLAPQGLSFYLLTREFEEFPETRVAFSVTKLLKMAHIEKQISYDEHSNEQFYTYTLTEEGVEAVLANERILVPVSPSPPSRAGIGAKALNSPDDEQEYLR